MHFLESLQSQGVVKLIIIDECHCICEWGHDFRPAYLKLNDVRNIFKGVRLLAMSATIPPEIKNELAERLSLHFGYYFQASYHRANLFYGTTEMESMKQAK